jgi:N-acetylglucosaminyldiphosphoundecaprenol N-acetyl-beta-D-mannosaminyltransferase
VIVDRTLPGYPVYAAGVEACLAEIEASLRDGSGPRWLACLNPHSWVVAGGRPAFEAALKDADWLIPDGVGIVLASRLRGGRLRSRVTGSDIFEGLSAHLARDGSRSVFYLGSTPEVLSLIRDRHERDFPGLRIAGVYAPPFKEAFDERDYDAMVEVVSAARPDVLWVGMTAPKQEEAILAMKGRLPVRFAAAIGAVFDFYSGRVKRSSNVARRVGLEWLPRLAREPRRLWRRNVNSLVFLAKVLTNRVR